MINNNIPPRQTATAPQDHPGYAHQPPPEASAHHALLLRDAAQHGDANAFPVLKAFQDYLETERQQARKRLVTLTIFFVSLMTLVVAGFIVALVFTFGKMSSREDRLLDEVLQQKKDALPSAPVLANLTAQQVSREFQSVAQNLQANLRSQIETADSVATNLTGKVEAQNLEMAKLRDALTALQKENASLRADLPKLAQEAARTRPPALAAPAPAAMPAPVAVAAAPAAPAPAPARLSSAVTPATTTAGTPAAAAGRLPTGYDETVLSIQPRKGESSIPWRTFVPSGS